MKNKILLQRYRVYMAIEPSLWDRLASLGQSNRLSQIIEGAMATSMHESQ